MHYCGTGSSCDDLSGEFNDLPRVQATLRANSNRLVSRPRHSVQIHDDWRTRPPTAACASMAAAASSDAPKVWRVRVSAELACLDEHYRTLDAVERARAARFRSETDRNRFVIARGSLRLLLGKHIGIDGAAVAFGTNAFGKPLLLGAANALHFNTSHSGEWIVHACDWGASIGVDVEAVICNPGDVAAIEEALSAGEWGRLQAMPESQRRRAFTQAWVRKEAYVKAVGEGFSRPLPSIEVDVDAAGHPYLRHDLNASSPQGWQIDDLEFDDDHVGCVVSRNDVMRSERVRFYPLLPE